MSKKTSKTNSELQWLAIARDALIRGDVDPSEAEAIIDAITGDSRDLDNETRQVAFERLNTLAHQCPGLTE